MIYSNLMDEAQNFDEIVFDLKMEICGIVWRITVGIRTFEIMSWSQDKCNLSSI